MRVLTDKKETGQNIVKGLMRIYAAHQVLLFFPNL